MFYAAIIFAAVFSGALLRFSAASDALLSAAHHARSSNDTHFSSMRRLFDFLPPPRFRRDAEAFELPPFADRFAAADGCFFFAIFFLRRFLIFSRFLSPPPFFELPRLFISSFAD